MIWTTGTWDGAKNKNEWAFDGVGALLTDGRFGGLSDKRGDGGRGPHGCDSRIVAATLVCWLVFLCLRKDDRHQGKKQPPGPWALPLVGNLGISNNGSLYQRSVEWAKVYGNIFRIKVGVTNVVVLYDVKTVKEFLAMEESLIRPPETVFYQICRGYSGNVSINSLNFAEHKK
ncbi:hypothetical protein ISCGN_008807 [Ixodes scapularis]